MAGFLIVRLTEIQGGDGPPEPSPRATTFALFWITSSTAVRSRAQRRLRQEQKRTCGLLQADERYIGHENPELFET